MLNRKRIFCNLTANWRLIVVLLCFLLLFVRLGLWQLSRAEEKESILKKEFRLRNTLPVAFSGEGALPDAYQPIQVRGNFLNVLLFLDNQHYQHRFGYDVIVPFVLENGKVVLVDRGWVPGDLNRINLPNIQNPVEIMDLTGFAYYQSTKSWSLGNIFDKKKSNVAVIELVDPLLIGKFLHKSVYPFMIRLGKGDPNGFVCDWAVVSTKPERHKAYAVQWFAMALLVIVLIIFLHVQKRR